MLFGSLSTGVSTRLSGFAQPRIGAERICVWPAVSASHYIALLRPLSSVLRLPRLLREQIPNQRLLLL